MCTASGYVISCPMKRYASQIRAQCSNFVLTRAIVRMYAARYIVYMYLALCIESVCAIFLDIICVSNLSHSIFVYKRTEHTQVHIRNRDTYFMYVDV